MADGGIEEPAPGEPLPILDGHSSPGRLERVLRAGQFAVTTEIAPPDAADAQAVFERASVFDGWVDAINATDGSGANCHMSSVGVCALLTRRGYAMVMQISCRDRNRIAIQGDVLGAAAMGVTSILCLTGDGVQDGDQPNAKPVFDFDCMTLLQTVTSMRDQGEFLSGRALSNPPRVFVGAAANPFAPPLDYRPLRLKKKIDADHEAWENSEKEIAGSKARRAELEAALENERVRYKKLLEVVARIEKEHNGDHDRVEELEQELAAREKAWAEFESKQDEITKLEKIAAELRLQAEKLGKRAEHLR